MILIRPDLVFCRLSDTVNPMVTVETCGEKKYTAAKSDVPCGSTAMNHWKEHLFFEPRNIVSFSSRSLYFSRKSISDD